MDSFFRTYYLPDIPSPPPENASRTISIEPLDIQLPPSPPAVYRNPFLGYSPPSPPPFFSIPVFNNNPPGESRGDPQPLTQVRKVEVEESAKVFEEAVTKAYETFKSRGMENAESVEAIFAALIPPPPLFQSSLFPKLEIDESTPSFYRATQREGLGFMQSRKALALKKEIDTLLSNGNELKKVVQILCNRLTAALCKGEPCESPKVKIDQKPQSGYKRNKKLFDLMNSSGTEPEYANECLEQMLLAPEKEPKKRKRQKPGIDKTQKKNKIGTLFSYE